MKHHRNLTRMLVGLLIGAIVLVAAAIVIVRLAVRTADIAPVDFSTLARPDSPNTALACPEGLCAGADLVTEPVALSATDLAARVTALPELEPRTAIAAADPVGGQFVLVQRSLVFGFPDSVNIAIRPIDPDHATLAVYSRSNYGHGDFGVNRTRVQRWLDRLGVKWRAAGPS